MTKRFAVLGLIITLVVSIAAIGCDGGGSAGPTPQPKTATAQPTEQPTQQPTSEPTATQETNPVATATSLDFTIEYVIEGQGDSTWRYRARNIGTSNLDIRIDYNIQGVGEYIYILSGSSQEGWTYAGGQWMSYTQVGMNFTDFWDMWAEGFDNYHQTLVDDWNGVQGWTYTVPGVGSVTYTNIDVNPSLPDSVFQPN
jgi:hypothetical protein